MYRQLSPELCSTHIDAWLGAIGSVFGKQGKFEEALTTLQDVLDLQRKSSPIANKAAAQTLTGIGHIYRELRKFPEALKHYEESLEMLRDCVPAIHPRVLPALSETLGHFSFYLEMERKLSVILQSIQTLLPRWTTLGHSMLIKGILIGIRLFSTGFGRWYGSVCLKSIQILLLHLEGTGCGEVDMSWFHGERRWIHTHI